MTTTAKKPAKRRTLKRTPLMPPSADLINISGRDYIIAPFDEFQEWEEDQALIAIMEERINDGSPYITFEEFEKHLEQKNKGRKK